jgi:hypothetical protein
MDLMQRLSDSLVSHWSPTVGASEVIDVQSGRALEHVRAQGVVVYRNRIELTE